MGSETDTVEPVLAAWLGLWVSGMFAWEIAKLSLGIRMDCDQILVYVRRDPSDLKMSFPSFRHRCFSSFPQNFFGFSGLRDFLKAFPAFRQKYYRPSIVY